MDFFVESGRGLQLIGLFLLGLVLGRIGFFTQVDKFERSRIKALGIALLAVIALYAADKYLAQLPDTFFRKKAWRNGIYNKPLGLI